MANTKTRPTRATTWGLIAGIVLLLSAFGNGSWLAGLAGVGVLIVVGRVLYERNLADKKLLEPWPWPADLRSLAEGMARPIDPTPKRLLPPHEKSSLVAQVATTDDALARLIADKPAAWPWAVFASVLVQRRNAVQGAFGAADSASNADAEAIVNVANRLMDYHGSLLTQAEACVQTPVEHEVLTFVQDAGAISLLPLLGYEQFITTMCARIGEAQELLPYGDHDTVMQLDDVSLTMTVPDDLTERFLAHVRQFAT